jgi:hypothetical protein
MLIDPLSFFVGFVTASIFWWLASKARPLWNEFVAEMQEQRVEAQARKTSTVEENHRRITLRRAQGMHLAASLFALEEVIQEPLLILPPPVMDPAAPQHAEDVVSQTLPYLPNWPEIAAAYHAPALTLPQALSGNANIVIIGQPGTGKTVALAHLASLAANRSEELNALQDAVPFLIHVADLNLPIADPKAPLKPIIEATSDHAPLLDLNRIPGFVENTFKSGKALLLVDGFDELAPEAQKLVTDYLKIIVQGFPKNRIVTTAAPEYLDGLVSLGFAPLAIMVWSVREIEKFIAHWGKLWSQTVALEAWSQASDQIDPLLLNTWLNANNANLSPLEVTLKTWGAYAGDLLGAHILEAIATHIRRIIPENTPLAALETLAMQVMLSAQPVFDPRKAREWVKSFETPEEKAEGEAAETPAENAEASETTKEDAKPKKGKKSEKAAAVPAASSGLLGKMAASGLLTAYPNDKMRFAHPIFAGYLAGHALTNYDADDMLLNQPDWMGKYLTMRYLAAHGDVTRIVQTLLRLSNAPMQYSLFAAARFLRDAPKNAPWRGQIFGALATIIQTEGLPLNLRGQAMAAFVVSNDTSVLALFRQLATTLSFEIVQLSVLGAGAARDTKSIEVLARAIDAPSMPVRRAACMALVSIGTNEALESVAQTLLNGDEDIRRAAAEALATDPGEGHAMLKEGITLNDILLRRSVVYGLGRTNEPWATEILQKVQVEDDQWVVRNAATEVLEAKANAGVNAPRKLKAPSEAPWLVEFAAKQGMGIAPGTPATDVLLQALGGEDANMRFAALPYLKFTPSEGVIAKLYSVMYSDDNELREYAYNILWEIGASGMKLPDPTQYGYR